MELTQFSEVDFYRARLEQLEREFMGHTLQIAEAKDNPDMSTADKATVTAASEAALAVLDVRHATAKALFDEATATAEKAKPAKDA